MKNNIIRIPKNQETSKYSGKDISDIILLAPKEDIPSDVVKQMWEDIKPSIKPEYLPKNILMLGTGGTIDNNENFAKLFYESKK